MVFQNNNFTTEDTEDTETTEKEHIKI